RLPPTSRLTSFGGRNLPPFACGSGGQRHGGGIRISPPWSGSGAGEYGRRPGGGASVASRVSPLGDGFPLPPRFARLRRAPAAVPSPASWGTDPGDFVPQPKVGGRGPHCWGSGVGGSVEPVDQAGRAGGLVGGSDCPLPPASLRSAAGTFPLSPAAQGDKARVAACTGGGTFPRF